MEERKEGEYTKKKLIGNNKNSIIHWENLRKASNVIYQVPYYLSA